MTHDTSTHDTTTHQRTRRRLTAVAICIYCGNDMIHGTGCSEEAIPLRSGAFPPIHWGDEKGYAFDQMVERCGDCGVPKGAVHHHGCDLEQCPSCRGQLLACGCWNNDNNNNDESHNDGDDGPADRH
jgi:hypothetical protein